MNVHTFKLDVPHEYKVSHYYMVPSQYDNDPSLTMKIILLSYKAGESGVSILLSASKNSRL